MSTHLERRAAMIRHKYRQGELAAKDLAVEEGISTRTAERRLRAGDYGPIIKRSKRHIRATVDGYINYLATKTVVLKASA